MVIKINDTLTQNIQDIENINETNNLVKSILLLAHPVGSYYWSSESTNPGELFGGTWTQIKDKFIIAVGDEHNVGVSYGSNTKNLTHSHESAAHMHSAGDLTACYDPINSYSNQLFRLNDIPGGFTLTGYIRQSNTWNEGGGAGSRGIVVVGNTGSTRPTNTGSSLSSTFDITPACEAAYCWKRIS